MRLSQFLALSLTFISLNSFAHQATDSSQTPVYQTGDLRVSQVWARAVPPNSPAGAAYFTLENMGSTPIRLLSAKSSLSDTTELHTHVHTPEGLMRMEQVPQVEIPAKSTLNFKPGSYHVMLMQPKEPLAVGGHFSLELSFEPEGTLQLDVPVLESAPQAQEPHAGHMHH